MAFSPDQAYDLIARAFSQQRLAHAFLIHGPSGDDIRALALRLANLVNHGNCETLDELKLHGVYFVEPEGKSRRIRIGTVRDFERTFYLTSAQPYKVGIIIDADRLNDHSANCFLKTLEEPPPNSLILLLTQQPDQLLPTIRSRCVHISLFRPGVRGMPLTEEQQRLVDALGRHFSGDLSTSRALILLSEFQSVLAEVRERIESDNKASYKEEVLAYGKTTDGSWLKNRDDYWSDLTEAQYHEERTTLLSLLFLWFGEILRQQVGQPSYDLPDSATVTQQAAKKLTNTEIHQRFRAIEELRRNLTTNVREPLAMEVAFLKAFG